MGDLQDIVSQYPDDLGGAYNPAPPDPQGIASFAPPGPAPMSPAAPPPAPLQPTSTPPQSPEEVRAAQQAILSSPALSEQQKQTALGALPRVGAGPAAPYGAGGQVVGPGALQGVTQMQPEGPRQAVPVPYPGAAGAGGAGTGLTPDDYLKLAAQGGGGARPGWNPQSRTVEGYNYSPQTIDSMGRTVAADANARGAQLDAEIAQGQAQGKANKVLGLYDETQAAEDKIHRDAQMSELAKYHDHIQSLQANADEASKINPDQFWSSKGAGQKIMLGLGMALRGFSFGLTGHGDPLEWLNQQIHENIEQQKAKAASARQAVGDAQNLYQFNKERLGDEDRAYQATALAQRAAIQGQLQRYVNDATAEPMGKLRAAQLMQANAQEISATQKDLDEKTAKQVTSEKFTPAGAGRDLLSQIDRAGKIKAGLEGLSGSDIGTREKEATIAKTEAETEAEKKKATAGPAKAQVDAYDNALDGLYEMRKMVAKGGTISSAETARGQALRNRLVNELARAQTGGTRAPSKEEQELIAAQLSKDPNAFQFTGADSARLDETIKAVERARARAAGTQMPGELPPGVTPGAVPGG